VSNKGKIYVLLSKHQGSNNQLVALAECIGNNYSINPICCELRSRKKVFYPFYKVFCKILLTYKIPFIFRKIINYCILNGDRPVLQTGDLIIGKTPPFEVSMMLLVHKTEAQKIFIGEPKHFSKKLFEHLISTPSTPVQRASITLSMMPTSMSYNDILVFEKTVVVDKDHWFFLIGGEANGFKYDDEDWGKLCDTIIAYAEKYNKKILISTSPRTGKIGENILRRRLERHNRIDTLFLWGEKKVNEESPLKKFMAISECIFVTEDSAGMISDALVARRPLISLRLQEDSYNSLSTPLTIYHANQQHLLRMVVGNNDVDLHQWIQDCFVSLQQSWEEELVSQLSV